MNKQLIVPGGVVVSFFVVAGWLFCYLDKRYNHFITSRMAYVLNGVLTWRQH